MNAAKKCYFATGILILHYLYLQVAQKAEEACSLLKSDLFEECWSIKDYAYYYARCMVDYCMRGDNLDVPVCNHAGALARECALEGVEIRWREDPRASSRCREYSRQLLTLNDVTRRDSVCFSLCY